MAKTDDIKTYGCKTLLQPFLDQANKLGRVRTYKHTQHHAACELIYMCTIQESGYNIQVNDEEITLHGAVICLCGDIPASSHIGGFKEGVGFALRKCRKCMARASDMSSKVQSNSM